METFFSIEDAARNLGGISPWTVRAWLSQRRLKRTKVGRRTVIAESELRRFVREQNAPKGERPSHPARRNAVGEKQRAARA